MIHKKHSFKSTMLAALLCRAPFISLHAQNPDGGQPRASHDPPPSPLFDALDANHDGVISAGRGAIFSMDRLPELASDALRTVYGTP